ncbi:DUF3850 domain-containing protein [Pseudomonas sp. NPDC090202]|uniref:DUF3850 domain-containing protein n=1 Tax=Pseudomonas sp. NPDC090202 TaxID=3364476 RepID=UPI00380EF652
MPEHILKIHSVPFEDLRSGQKNCEVRNCSDRDFQTGDTVRLLLIDDAGKPANRELLRTITHIQRGYGLPDDLCVLSYGWQFQFNQDAFQAEMKAASLSELTDDLREILGRPNFTCNGIAQMLRTTGRDIPRKSEEEQAATIHWLLGHYLQDRINWRANASNELRTAAEKYKTASTADQGEVGTYPQEGL